MWSSMFAIAFDLNTEATKRHHPRGRRAAYLDIERLLEPHGFNRIQGSTYAADHEDQARLYLALSALHSLEWFGPSLNNIRVFRMEAGADFTEIMKSPIAPPPL